MHVTVLIPARMEATRFPGKPLVPILGKPMIQWVYERAARSSAAAIAVATDSPDIFEAVEQFGGQAVMTATAHSNGTSRIAEVAAKLDTDIVVNVQGDEPTIQPQAIDQVIAPFKGEPDLEMATLAEPLVDAKMVFNPNVVKVVCRADGNALYFSRAPLPYVKHQGMHSPTWPVETSPRDTFLRHVGIYAYRRDFLLTYASAPACALEQIEGLEQLRALHMGARIRVTTTHAAGIGVDTPEDLPRAEQFLKQERGTA